MRFMKKIIRFLLNSVALFWSYFLSSLLILFIIMVPLRFFIPAESKAEYLWKTIVLYLAMTIVCTVHLLITAPIYKVNYLRSLGGEKWNLKSAFLYTVKKPMFWYNFVGFAVWPVILPRLFGVINLLYFDKNLLQSFPNSILVILTVDIPFLLLSILAWMIVLKLWSKKRLHLFSEEQNKGETYER